MTQIIHRAAKKAAAKIHRAWRRHQVFIERGTATSPIDTEETECRHCGHVFRGNYCPRCGQNRNAAKGKPKFIKTFREAYPQLSNNFVRTMYHLVVRPGYMVRDYLTGHRVIYQNPVSTFVIAMSLYILFTGIHSQFTMKKPDNVRFFDTIAETIEKEYAKGIRSDKKMYSAYSKWKRDRDDKPEGRKEISLDIIKGMLTNDTMFVLLFFFPILGVTSWAVFRRRPFRGRRLTVTEHYIFYTFLYSSVVVFLDNTLIITFLYTAWAYRGLYRLSWPRAVLSTVLVAFICLIVFALAVYIFGFALLERMVRGYL